MFNTNIHLYGIMIDLAIVANVIIVLLTSRKSKLLKYEVISALVYENAGIIFGAKIFTYLQNIDKYDSFNFLELGLSSLGAVIGALLCLLLFCIQFKKNIKEMLFIFMPPLPLMYAIGKIGCFLVGCCYGIEYKGIGNITYHYSKAAPNNVSLFPVQLLESIVFTLIFIYIIKHILKKDSNWQILGLNFILCGIAKFLLDFLRMSHTNVVLSLNQIICLIFIIIGFIIYKKVNKVEALNEV